MSEAVAINDAASEPRDRCEWQSTRSVHAVQLSLLAVCTSLALVLALAHVNAVELPGCGTVSDCTRAAESRWGRIPGTDWPLAFVGFAYFQALTAAFIYSGGRLTAMLRAIVLMGAVVSAVLIAVMFVNGYVCGYCLTIHVLNMAFAVGCVVAWRNGRPTTATTRWAPLAVFLLTAVATSLLLAVAEHTSESAEAASRGNQLQQALQAAGTGSTQKGSFAPGRYLLGPQTARVHVTIVSDYQCPSCRAIESQLRAMTAGRDDVSISVRHFPLCSDCNEYVNKSPHPNACRAALAAEAAGIVGGASAFWRTSDWLFQRRGEFTDEELRQFVPTIGLAPRRFLMPWRVRRSGK